MTNISDQINEYVTEANRFVINYFPKPAAIASYIDLPIFTLLTLNPFKIIPSVAVATATYQIRANINYYLRSNEFNEYIKNKTNGMVDIKYTIDSLSEMTGIESKFIIGSIAGTVGGTFRYYVTGHNPLIGALNNIAYETCNNIDLCSNNKAVNFTFAITVEILDATAQATIKLGTGNVLGAAYSAITGGATVIQKLNAAIDLLQGSSIDNLSIDSQNKLSKILGKKFLKSTSITKIVETIMKGSNAEITKFANSLSDGKLSDLTNFLAKLGMETATNSVIASVKTGMLVGSMIGVTGNFFYAPALELKVQENTFYGYAEKAYNSIFIDSNTVLGELNNNYSSSEDL